MIEKKIRALKDIGLKTYGGSYRLVENEVKIVLFKNIATFKALLNFGNFVEAGRHEEESKPPIPVFLPEEEPIVGEFAGGNYAPTSVNNSLPSIELICDGEEDNQSEK